MSAPIRTLPVELLAIEGPDRFESNHLEAKSLTTETLVGNVPIARLLDKRFQLGEELSAALLHRANV